tara:strand:- start:38552 stop:39172 length:621 start_codon:yes stop_codon:yes gene_type:complete
LYFSSLKNVLGDKDWIHKKEIKDLNIPYSLRTSKLYLEDLVKNGYAKRTKKGYILKGIKKVANEKFNTNIKYSYSYTIGDTKKETIARVAYSIVRSSIVAQKKTVDKKNGLKAVKGMKFQWGNSDYSMSVRTVSKLCGFKSAITGSQIERLWERLGLAKIERRTVVLCNADGYSILAKSYPELRDRCFIKGNEVAMRLCNNIIPVM